MNKVNTWLAERVKNAEAKAEETKDLNERIAILNDYTLIFLGASQALEAVGQAEGAASVNHASEVINSMIDTFEKRLKLEESLK